MNAPTSVFQLGRMRHLDLLALYFRLNPDTHLTPAVHWMSRFSKEGIVEAILRGTP